MKKSVVTLVLWLVLCLSASVRAMSADRDYWIDRYLSVSYPLKRVKVSSPYGKRKDPFTGKRAVHGGLDLHARYEEVYSMFDGVVEKIGSDSRSGHFIVLRHGMYTISFCHLSKVTAHVGEELIAGDVVGISGNSGRSTGPHLHLTVKREGTVVDPYTLLLYVREVRAEAAKALGLAVVSEDVSTAGGRRAFLEHYAPLAIEQQRKYGIPASVTLAQLAWESSWGTSTLAVDGNNFFGIKCSNEWLSAGKPYSLHDDDRPGEKFCNYASVEESFDHRSRLLMSDRYRRCHRYGATDYHNWLVGIKASGYATAPDYVSKLEGLIKKYRLYEYDRS